MAIKIPYTEKQKKLATYAKALGHPARIFILEKLASESCCYSGDMAEEIPIARSTLSQHLNDLKKSGLIQGEIKPPKIKYCINYKNWMEAKKLFSEIFLQIPPKNKKPCIKK
jgi:ArsR family transcriptional regulator, arsenate/arsenite/antimonite-responsive transcriptional repressor